MERPAWMAAEPLDDLGVLVGGVVVQDGVDELAGRNVALDGVEEADELLVTVLLHAAPDHRPIQDVEGGEQGGRTVAFVVMGQGPAFARLERQARLGAVQRLDLGLLVDGQHQSGGAGGCM